MPRRNVRWINVDPATGILHSGDFVGVTNLYNTYPATRRRNFVCYGRLVDTRTGEIVASSAGRGDNAQRNVRYAIRNALLRKA